MKSFLVSSLIAFSVLWAAHAHAATIGLDMITRAAAASHAAIEAPAADR